MNIFDQVWEVDLSFPDDFLKVKETLTRIGIRNRSSDALFQQAHILHKQGRYYIIHFKQLYALDGMSLEMRSSDYYRLERIVKMLYKWELVERYYDPVEIPNVPRDNETNVKSSLFVIPYAEKEDWTLIEKYTMGEIYSNL